MSDQGSRMTHPTWCDPAHCTAPALRPTSYEGNHGKHRSADLGNGAGGNEVFLSQGVAPWQCNTHLNVIYAGDSSLSRCASVILDYNSPLVWAILAEAGDMRRDYAGLMDAEAAKRGLPAPVPTTAWRAVEEASLPTPRDVNAEPAPLVDERNVDERETKSVATVTAEVVIDGWTPGTAASTLPQPRKLWVHSGPCIYCAHGPACVTCDLAEGPHWGTGSPGHEYPGPVCSNCSEECKRREIAADPYYSGDYVTMFGDDE